MREKTIIVKRIFLMFLVIWITFISVFGAYQKSVEAAEWVAGTIAAIGGAPVLSALLIGGVVVAGGIAIYELSQTTSEDHRNFVDGIKTGFQEFVADREKQIALEQDSSLTDQQAADRGVAVARETVNNFTDNAINVTKTTAKNLKTKTVDYWNKFCKGVSGVSDNGISGDTNINANTVITNNLYNYSDVSISARPETNIGANAFNMNGYWYLNRYNYVSGINNGNAETRENYVNNVNNYNPCLCYIVLKNNQIEYYINRLRYTDSYVMQDYSTIYWAIYGFSSATLATLVSNTSLPTWIVTGDNDAYYNNYIRTHPEACAIGHGQSSIIPNWQRTVNGVLEDTHIGKAIRSGRRAKLQSGDYIGSTFVDDSIPVKKTALRVGDTTAVGQVGWDVPAPAIWDDVFSGGRPFSDVVRDTGVIAVPSDDVTSYPTDTEVEFPTDTDVQDTDDVIDIPIDDDIEIPERPIDDIVDDQEGDFYPYEMDLINIFPFCIPFDIYYLIEKFDVSGAHAPVITLPLKYPDSIRGAMGSDSYVVTINLADYVVVRDVIRVFLLLLYIAGLMKVTRDLIRG